MYLLNNLCGNLVYISDMQNLAKLPANLHAVKFVEAQTNFLKIMVNHWHDFIRIEHKQWRTSVKILLTFVKTLIRIVPTRFGKKKKTMQQLVPWAKIATVKALLCTQPETSRRTQLRLPLISKSNKKRMISNEWNIGDVQGSYLHGSVKGLRRAHRPD